MLWTLVWRVRLERCRNAALQPGSVHLKDRSSEWDLRWVSSTGFEEYDAPQPGMGHAYGRSLVCLR